MSIDFIQARMSELDHYLGQLDTKVKQNFAASNPQGTTNRFANILESVVNTEDARASVKGKIKPDNLSKLPEDFDEYIDEVAAETSSQYGVEITPNLLKSVIKQESGFNPDATSHAGAQGLMQLMPATAKSLGVFNSMNPYQNVKGGAKYLAQMLQKFDGNLQKALAAYNAGPQAVERHGTIPPYKETQNYVASIMHDYLNREDYQPIDMIG